MAELAERSQPSKDRRVIGTASWIILTVIFSVASGFLWRNQERLVGHSLFVSRGIVLYFVALGVIVSGLGLSVVLIRIA
jgi:hypothetical protein